jgi:predicted outer membrane repeat protein
VVGDGTAASCTEAALVAALAGGGLVTFNCGGPATIILSVEQDIQLDTTIDGGGLITLSGGDTTRLFFSDGGVRLTISNIILRDGGSPVGGGLIEASGAHVALTNVRLLSSSAAYNGGAIYCYVDTGGTLTIRGSTFENNTATSGGAIYNDGCAATISDSLITGSSSGAIYTAGPLAISSTEISRNSGSPGGGLHVASGGSAMLSGVTISHNNSNGGDGGGIYVASGGSARITASTVHHNVGGYGGGIENSGALTVTGSLIQANEVSGSGGGIWNMGGKLWVENSTISANVAYEGAGINSYGTQVELSNVNVTGNRAIAGPGGGIYHGAGVFYITNATISANQAVGDGASGGGLYISSDDNSTLMNVTLSGNQAGLFGGGLYHQSRYTVLVNVTIAGNDAAAAGDAIYENATPTAQNPGVIQIGSSVIFGSSSNCSGQPFESFGHNVVAGACPWLNHATDQQVSPADLHMGELGFNGGIFAMRTIIPLAGSPAINAGSPADCPAIDQRGAARVGACDAGAGEYDGRAARALIPLIIK